MKSTLLSLVLLVVAVPTESQAFRLKTDTSGSPVRVASQKVIFRLPTSAPPGIDLAEVHRAINDSLAAWSKASGLDLQSVPGDPHAVPGYVPKGENHNDIVFVEEGWKWDDGAVAITLISTEQNSHTILDTDILFNAQKYKFAVIQEGGANDCGFYDDIQNTFNHELGHALGMGHSEFSEAVMYGQAERGEISKRVLFADDIAGIQFLYSSIGTNEEEIPGKDEQLDEASDKLGCSAASTQSAPLRLGVLAALLWIMFVQRKTRNAPAKAITVDLSPRKTSAHRGPD